MYESWEFLICTATAAGAGELQLGHKNAIWKVNDYSCRVQATIEYLAELVVAQFWGQQQTRFPNENWVSVLSLTH